MKILWLCNIIIPQICEKLNIPQMVGGSWITSLADILDQNTEIDFGICAPCQETDELIFLQWGKGSSFFGFKRKRSEIYKFNSSLEKLFQKILEQFKPDIVHIFGTEFPHTLSMVRAFNNPEKTIIQIQGLASIVGIHYTIGLSYFECKRKTIRDLIKMEDINRIKKKMLERGKYEIEAIQKVKNILGRTNWDKACALQINSQANYYHCPEILRESFYNGKWEYKNCIKYRIFMSQASYPVKGLHFVLEAMNILKEKWSDIQLYIAGDDILNKGLKESYYGKLIRNKIKRYHLQDKINFIGSLNEEQMKIEYLKSNVFVSASTIENESNSISEAKMLGVPVVASYVGGVTDRLKQGETGFFYPVNEPYMLAYYIEMLFMDEDLTKKISENAILDAKKINDKDMNKIKLFSIYKNIYSNEGKN